MRPPLSFYRLVALPDSGFAGIRGHFSADSRIGTAAFSLLVFTENMKLSGFSLKKKPPFKPL
jgi:hypothetical protein